MAQDTLKPGSIYSGRDYSSQGTVFQLEMQPGKSFGIVAGGSRSGQGTLGADGALISLSLMDKAGNVLSSSYADSNGEPKLLYHGYPNEAYVIVQASKPYSKGTYTLQWIKPTASDDAGADADGAVALAGGATARGKLDYVGDHDWYALTLEQGSTYQFKLGGGAAAFATVLRDHNGKHLGATALQPYTALSSGTYYLDVAGPDFLVDYSASVTRMTDDFTAGTGTTGKLALSGNATGKIDSINDSDWFAITLHAGRSYRFALDQDGNHGPQQLTLYDAAGQRLVQNTEAGPSHPAIPLIHAAAATATYYVAVSGPGQRLGDYRLTAAPVDDHGNTDSTQSPVALGQTVHGMLETKGDEDRFKADLKAGTSYRVALAPDADGGLDLAEATLRAKVVDGGTASQTYTDVDGSLYVVLRPEQDARASIAVSHGQGAIGSYQMQLSAYTADDFSDWRHGAAKLTLGSAVAGKFERPIDRDWFQVELKAGQPYAFSLDNKQGNGSEDINYSTLTLVSPSGVELDTVSRYQAYPVSFVYTPTAAGVYYLSAQLTTGTLGSYTLSAAPTLVPDGIAPLLLQAGLRAPDGLTEANSQIAVSYDAALLRGKGSITISSGTGTVLASYDAATSANVRIDGKTLYITPDQRFSDGASYRYSLAEGAVTDANGDPSAAFKGVFIAAAGGQLRTGGAGADHYDGNGNGNSYDGGAGLDTVRYLGTREQYLVSGTPAGHKVAQRISTSGGDTLRNIERLLFDDGAIALDSGGLAGQAYRLYRAAFDRVPDEAGVGFWIKAFEHGATLHAVAKSFLASSEFTTLYGSKPGDAAFVDTLYQNVLHRAPDTAGRAYWINTLHNGAERATLLTSFSESAEHSAAVALIIGNGFAYQPYS